MLKYGFSNLRRLRDVAPVELRPITLLVGRNSSGKSTFLRTFPLFRQSISTRTSSPVLWYGDLVDFGSYEASVSSGNQSEPIVFKFEIDELTIASGNSFGLVEMGSHTARHVSGVAINIYIVPYVQRTRISKIVIRIDSLLLDIDLTFDTSNHISKVYINGNDAKGEIEKYTTLLTAGALFPDLRVLLPASEAEALQRVYWYPAERASFEKMAFDILRGPLDARISNKSIEEFVKGLFENITLSKNTLRNYEKFVSSTKFKSFIRDMSGADQHTLHQKLCNMITLAALPRVISSISSHLRGIFGSTLYIGPARARSERYYRYQDLAVSEIDPDGKNFPMFLNSLTRRQRTSLSSWIESLFGYGVDIKQESGHISIKLIEGETEVNIVDVGYGVSQILPVLGQIWWARARREGPRLQRKTSLIAIEQPELHLHPAHQALLADAIVGETKQRNENPNQQDRISFLVETHSETLVNRLGTLIAEGTINAHDVQILLFEQDEKDASSTSVRSVNFDDDGVLIDWPYGFFQPEM